MLYTHTGQPTQNQNKKDTFLLHTVLVQIKIGWLGPSPLVPTPTQGQPRKPPLLAAASAMEPHCFRPTLSCLSLGSSKTCHRTPEKCRCLNKKRNTIFQLSTYSWSPFFVALSWLGLRIRAGERCPRVSYSPCVMPHVNHESHRSSPLRTGLLCPTLLDEVEGAGNSNLTWKI